MYGDGANLNALLGIVRPGDLGFDVMHYQPAQDLLHPARRRWAGLRAGGRGCAGWWISCPARWWTSWKKATDEDRRRCTALSTRRKSIGRVKAFNGHFGMLVRAFTYMRMHGPEGLRKIAEYAVLNANYLLARLKDAYHVPYDRICMHEFVAEGRWADAPDIHALDIAKRLMDYGFHPPTNYFPLIVHEALMIEPTETESKQTLDGFAEALLKIAEEAHSEPELLKTAPHITPVGRLDEVKAAKELVLCCGVGPYQE